MFGRVDRVHQAELVLFVLLALPEVMFGEVLQGLRVHLLLGSKLGLLLKV